MECLALFSFTCWGNGHRCWGDACFEAPEVPGSSVRPIEIPGWFGQQAWKRSLWAPSFEGSLLEEAGRCMFQDMDGLGMGLQPLFFERFDFQVVEEKGSMRSRYIIYHQ